MKRLFTALFIFLLVSFLLTGCSNTNGKVIYDSNKENGYFQILEKGEDYTIVYDRDTKVKYFLIQRGYQGGITVLYNSDGTLQKYGEKVY